MKRAKNGESDLAAEVVRLRRELALAVQESKRTREEHIALGIIRAAPMAFWAADRDCKIVFWSKQAEVMYNLKEQDALGRDYVQLFVDPAEQNQAREDTATIVDEGLVWKNFLAYDHRSDGSRLTMLTNSFRVWDEECKAFVQAEIGLEISDLHMSEEKHRTLREAGTAMLALQRRALESERRDLAMRVSKAFIDKRRQLDEKQRDADKWVNLIAKEDNKAKAEKIAGPLLEDISTKATSLEDEHSRLLTLVTNLQTLDEATAAEADVLSFECCQDYS